MHNPANWDQQQRIQQPHPGLAPFINIIVQSVVSIVCDNAVNRVPYHDERIEHVLSKNERGAVEHEVCDDDGDWERVIHEDDRVDLVVRGQDED